MNTEYTTNAALQDNAAERAKWAAVLAPAAKRTAPAARKGFFKRLFCI